MALRHSLLASTFAAAAGFSLERPLDERLDVAVMRVAAEAAEVADAGLRLDLADVAVPQATADGLLRIVGEAVANAVRHADAQMIRVELAKDGRGLRLRVADDGKGFEPAEAGPNSASGLGVMHDEALALGAELRIVSSPGAGCEIEVVLP